MVSEKLWISQTMNGRRGDDGDRRDMELRSFLVRDDATTPCFHDFQCECRMKVGAETNGIGLTDCEQ